MHPADSLVMNLPTAIAHAQSKAQGDTPCAAEHKQLALWLTELQELRSVKRCTCPSKKGPATVRQWQKEIHEYAKAKGWWDEDKPRSFGDLCMLFVTEIAEAYEEFRSHKDFDEVYFNPEKPGKPEGIPTELADCVIRIIDWFGAMGIDLQSILEQKHTYNQTRAYRHGNRKV